VLAGLAAHLISDERLGWRDPHYALTFASAAYARAPAEEGIADTYATVLATLGAFDEAIAITKAAIDTAKPGAAPNAARQQSLAYYQALKAQRAKLPAVKPVKAEPPPIP